MSRLTRPVVLALVVALIATACGSSSGEEAATLTGDGADDAATTASDAIGDQSPNSLAEYSWQNPDPFDASFGDGSTVMELEQVLPDPEALPIGWSHVDVFNDDVDSALCAGNEPDAAIQVAWFVPPPDVGALLPDIVVLNVEDHGTAERALQASSLLGSDLWIECQASLLDGVEVDAVSMSSDNPAGEAYDSPLPRPNLQAVRQQVDATAFGAEFSLVGDTHVWTEGSRLFALSIMATGANSDQLALQASGFLTTDPTAAPPAVQSMQDELVGDLRRSIERDPAALPFFFRQARAQFLDGVPEEFQDCASATATPASLVLNGPVWITGTGASLMIQGGVAFDNEQAAIDEIARYESVGETCIVERATPVLGDSEVVSTRSERIMVDGVEVLLVEAEITQLATNEFVPRDIDALAQRTMAVSGTSVVGFGFLGVAGDEPDLVALTVDAVTRMSGG